jgi:3D (Asp-Asp-Asp) domain-containing protein
MLNDLVNPTTTNATPNTALARLARRLLVAVSLVIGVGLAGVGFARGQAEPRPTIVWVRGQAVVLSQPVSQDRPTNVVSMVETKDGPSAELLRELEPQLVKATIQPNRTAKSRPGGTVASVAAKRVVMMEVTAYCPCTKCCGPKAQGLTASGKPVSYNDGLFVAADRKLPFGTKLTIPGYGDGRPVQVIDRGGAIKGDKVDVFFPSHTEALQWGRQKLAVTVEAVAD